MASAVVGERARAPYACARCGEPHGVLGPRCKNPRCRAWRQIRPADDAAAAPRQGGPRAPRRERATAQPITQIKREQKQTPKIPTREPQFNRVLGGGIPRGAVLLFSGPPGAGKSTILLALSGELAADGHRVLYATAEELSENVAERAERIAAEHDELFLIATKQLSDVQAAVRELRPDVLIIDSISKIAATPKGAPGSPSEMNAASEAIERMAIADPAPDSTGRLAVLVVIHVTKSKGEIAGAMSVQHLFGGTFFLERIAGGMRSLTGRKNRFGPDTTGYFDMTEAGLRSIENPSERFLADHEADLPGSVVTPVIADGDQEVRASLVEVQAAVGDQLRKSTRVLSTGIDLKRLEQRLVVIDQWLSAFVGAPAQLCIRDVSVNVPGGVDASERAMDLPIALAIASSALRRAIPPDAVVFGEIGLVGEMRGVPDPERRLEEGATMRFRRAIAPRRSSEAGVPKAFRVDEAPTLLEALRLAFPGLEGCATGAESLIEWASDKPLVAPSSSSKSKAKPARATKKTSGKPKVAATKKRAAAKKRPGR